MKTQKKPENAIFYGNYKDMIYNATPEQVKAIMVAFCEYAFDDKTPTVPPEISLVWEVIKGNIDADFKQYTERCEKNRENALKRYNKEPLAVVYASNGEEYEIIYPPKNERNIVSEERFNDLFGELDDINEERNTYLLKFVEMGNTDQWKKPFETYEQATWEEIYKGTV